MPFNHGRLGVILQHGGLCSHSHFSHWVFSGFPKFCLPDQFLGQWLSWDGKFENGYDFFGGRDNYRTERTAYWVGGLAFPVYFM